MKAIQIEIPTEIVLSLKMPYDSVKKRLTEELALHLYQEGLLSFGKARELAALSKWEFGEKLGDIPRYYSEDDLEEDFRFATEAPT
jgi:predicted HTH domain antitoxin